MAADSSVEWTRDLGEGRLLVMKRAAAAYRASLVGFGGVGSTQETVCHYTQYLPADSDQWIEVTW